MACVVRTPFCTGTGETDVIDVWVGGKSVFCVCQGSSRLGKDR